MILREFRYHVSDDMVDFIYYDIIGSTTDEHEHRTLYVFNEFEIVF